jgi:hypothetical protein
MALIDKDYVKLRVKKSDLIALTETVGQPGTINTAMIDALIADADAIILNALRGRYKIPVSGTAEALSYLQRLEFDICLYYIYSKTYTSFESTEMKDVYVKYSQAFKEINAIKAGTEIRGLDLETGSETIPPIILGTSNRRYFPEHILRKI